jgi:alpha-tubulin suppressor-like RCC1 family protein
MKLLLARRKLHMVIYVVLAVLVMSSASLLFFSCGGGHVDAKSTAPQAVSAKSLSQAQAVQCSDVATIAAGWGHTVGLKEDGTAVAVGYNGDGELDVSSWTNIKAIAAGAFHTVGLKDDGTVVAVGDNSSGALDVSSWTGVKAIAAGWGHTVGLKEDGTVVAVGDNGFGQLNVSSWTNIKAIAAGFYQTVGLKEDGTVVTVGFNGYGQLNVSSWTNIKAIAAGAYHTVGLKEDGTIVAVGFNGYGQLNVSSWTNIQAIAAGFYHTVGLKEDGTVVTVGDDSYGQIDVSSWLTMNVVAAGAYHTVGLKEDGTVMAVGNNDYGQTNVVAWTNIMPLCEQDVTPPTSSALIISSLGNNGWYVSDVQMTLTAADTIGGSGVKEIHYTVDGTETVVQGNSASFSISGDGNHAVSYYAIDNAGNVETPSHVTSINIDKTPPSAPSLSASPSVLCPTNHKIENVLIGGSFTDNGSGVASSIITVTDEYGVFNMTVPGFGSVVQLESWRKDTDIDGRLYTITAIITDNAGNQSTATTTVLVPHDACTEPHSADRLRVCRHHDRYHDHDDEHHYGQEHHERDHNQDHHDHGHD